MAGWKKHRNNTTESVAEVGRVPKKTFTTVKVALQHIFTEVREESSRPRNYSSKNKKMFSKNTGKK